jgi:uncharacterized OB-fold protein
MTLFTRVRRLFVNSSDIRECRRCGTSLGPEHDRCVNCGAEDIVCYDIE